MENQSEALGQVPERQLDLTASPTGTPPLRPRGTVRMG